MKFEEKCKREYSFLKLRYQGVYLAIAKITEWKDKEKYSNHAFVYNTNYIEAGSSKKVCALIDNWDDCPIKIIEQSDIKDERTAKVTLNDYFGGIVTLKGVFKIEKINDFF